MEIEEERSRMQSQLFETKTKNVTSVKRKKSVPTSIVSSKIIQKEKASAKVIDKHGKEITMEEMMKQSKEGQVGKRGAAYK